MRIAFQFYYFTQPVILSVLNQGFNHLYPGFGKDCIPMKEYLLRLIISLSFFIAIQATLSAQPCECTNCPVPITDNGTFEGYLDVTVDGPNDLSQCNLQQVCFEITHTWIGDLSATLVSPGGLNYMVMADLNNNFGGCGNNSDNVDVCIELGTANPLTNNTEYVCNNGNPCLIGQWTLPCGGVTDPVSGAVQAPNCDLNDYNLPGQPANGTWALVVNDICAQDVGFLETWSLVFACGVVECFTVDCDADGGELNQPDVTGCFGDPSLNLNITPNYPSGPPPPPNEYSYTYVVSQGGIIFNFIDGPDLSTVPAGTYEICGLSYLTTDQPDLFPFIGQPFSTFENTIQTSFDPICGDLSADCFTATIGPPIPPTIQDTMICLGDCYTAPTGLQCCSPGPCQYTVPSSLGCDSTIIVNITTHFNPPTLVDTLVCPDECVTIDGVDYCPTGVYALDYTDQFGCDSIVTLTVTSVPINAFVIPPDEITCATPGVILDGTGSLGITWEWTDENGMVIGNVPVIVVMEGGCYTLTVTNTLLGVTCSDSYEVCVTEDLILPGPPVINGPTVVCQGDVEVYTITADPDATDYIWTIPPDATVVSGGDGTTAITIDWTGSAGGDVCVFAANACGMGPETCISVTVSSLPATPIIVGPTLVCEDQIADYTVTNDPATDSYTWTVPAGATITAGQGTNTITVDWGSSAGGNVCVTASNTCGDSPEVCLPVTITPLVVDPVVSGPDPVCVGDTVIYSTPDDPNTGLYTWTVPSCATIVSGDGTNSITVAWDGSCAGGDVCVTASNACGSSGPVCQNVTVESAPALPDINGNDIACVGETTTYTSTDIADNTYTWTVTGGTISSGQGTSSVDVSWTVPGTGTVCLISSNSCGDSPEACMDVEVGDVPDLPTINGLTVVCDGTITTYTIDEVSGATNYVWTAFCGMIVSGQGTNEITVDFTGCAGGSDICVLVVNDCGNGPEACLSITGGSPPDAPTITGEELPCNNTSETYCANIDPNISDYTWTVTGGTITSGQGTECVTIDWTSAGAQQVCVTGSNGCGDSPEVCFDVEVDDVAEAPVISIFDLPCENSTESYSATSTDPDVTGFTWSVSCGQIVGGQGTANVDILWDNSTPGPCEICVTADNVCGPSQQTCLPVTIVEFPTVDAGADDAVCDLTYLLSALPGLGTGSWTYTGPGTATFGDENAANTTVTVDVYGDYTFTWTESATQADCESSDDVVISFDDDPQLSGAVEEICTLDEQNYTVSFTITGGEMPYVVTGNVTGTLIGNDFTSDLIPSGTPYSFEVFDDKGCGPILIEGQETCNCVTDAGTLDITPIITCEDLNVTVDVPVDTMLDPNDTFEFILHTDNGTNGNTLGTILDQNMTGLFTFLPGVMNIGETYFISIVAGNDIGGTVDLSEDCADIAQGIPVTFYNYPVVNAGADDSVCGLSYDLSATPEVGGNWFVSGGPGFAVFSQIDDPNSTVTVSEFGTYLFVWTEDNNGCSGADEVQITFNAGPTASVTSETCDILNLNYTVSFDISGGLAPYTVVGSATGTLSGSTFDSDPIPAGTSYSFEVTDANGCGPFLVEGLVDCPCTTDAGTMSQTLVEVCVGEFVTVDPATGANLDPEDILVYVLHNGSGAMLGTEVYGINTVPTFELVPPMMENTTYYISAMAGNDVDLDGVIDTNDPCVVVSIGTPVQFLSLPEVSFVGGDTVCEGEDATLTLVVNSLECVDVSYELIDGTVETVLCVNDGDMITVPTTTISGTVTILDVVDANGCVGTGGAFAEVTVNLEPTAVVTDIATICNSTDSGMSTMLDFGTLLTGGDISGTWENTDNAGISGSFPIVNFDGAIPGNYTFTYTTASAQAPCEETSYEVEVTVEDCECPDLGLLPGGALCNDGDQLDVSDLEITTEDGSWTLVGLPPGTNPATLTGTIFDASGADPGDYTLQFNLDDAPPVGCADFSQTVVTVSDTETAGVPLPALEFCADASDIVDLNGLLTGADQGGAWAETSIQPSTGSAFNAAAGTFNITGQDANTYSFAYTVTPDAPCPVETATVQVVIHPLPIADAGQDFTLTCFEDVTQVGGISSAGPDIVYDWSAANGPFPGDSTVVAPEVTVAGIYTLVVTNQVTGCSASDVVEIEADQDTPSPVISLIPVSCFGDSDGAIIVESVEGGQPPYVYSLNGEPYTQTGSFFNLSAASYTITVQDANGCETEVLTINIEQPQEVGVELVALIEGDNMITLGDSLNLLALTSLPEDSIDVIQWEPADLVNCDTCLLTSANPLETTNFSIYVESNGCSDADALTIAVRKERDIYVPNIFSPNGDGDNDIFYIFGGSTVAKINSFLVFNRWGETVHQYYNFEPNNPAYGWDGTFRGELMNPAVFTWFAEVEYIDGLIEIIEGDVTLVR